MIIPLRLSPNFLTCRSNKLENKNDELNKVEKQVDKYKDVLEKIHKKFSPSAGTDQDREKRIKKVNEYRLAQTLEETAKDLPEELCLFNVMKKCGKFVGGSFHLFSSLNQINFPNR